MPVDLGVNFDSRQFNFISELLTRLSRPTPSALDRIERSVRVGFMQNFARQSVGGGAPWAALSPRTQRERLRQGYPATAPILRRTNAYATSWTRVGGWRALDRGSSGWVLHVSSDHRWAFAHELGVRRQNLPARPVRYLDNGQQRVVAAALDSWVNDIVRQVMT